MCRECQMGLAAAQQALHSASRPSSDFNPERIGVVFGSDYMLTLPDDFTAGVARCRAAGGGFDFSRWASEGMPQITPLWLLKYLPNMPASHLAIYNDLRGPNNSITLREASANLAVGEAFRTIARGHADVMVAGGDRHAGPSDEIRPLADAGSRWPATAPIRPRPAGRSI